MKKETKKSVMDLISEDKIKIKSRFVFIARSIGFKSGLTLLVVVLVFLVNLFFYFIKSNNLLLSIHYGPSFWQMMLHSLPYDLIIIITILFIIVVFIFKKTGFAFKQSAVIILLFLGIAITLLGLALFTTNLNEQLYNHFTNSNVNAPYVGHFYTHRCNH